MPYRVCAGCGENLSDSEYSSNQWRKAAGVSRCTECISEGVTSDSNGFGTARSNLHTTRIDVNYPHARPFASGSFRDCYRGTYAGGSRTGQRLVAKFFKPQYRHMEGEFFARDADAVEQACRIITQWNQSGYSPDTFIRLNIPEKWEVSGSDCFIEPFIDGFFKINSNTGWQHDNSHEQDTQKADSEDVLQALSHFSYHRSSGQFLLCDLQGGIFRDGVILTDPVIQSSRKRFGPTDLGREGMESFFYYHRCTQYCRSDWTLPRTVHPHFQQSSHTTMVPKSRHSPSYDSDDSEY